MVNHQSNNGICVRIRRQISELGKIVANFTIFYFTLFLLSVPLILMILWRFLVTLTLRLFYNGRYTIVPPAAALLSSNKLPSTMNLNFVIIVNDVCDIHELRTRILTNISATDKDWNIPYKSFFHAVVEKFGFYCFEDKRKSFDINHHVRLCPEVENTQQIYTESEMFSMIETTAFQEWDCSRPRWEMLLIPKIKFEETNQICSAIGINISHVYVDGISLSNFIRNCVVDQPSPKLNFDPVNPPIPRVNMLKRIILYIKMFFNGPHILLKNSGRSNDQLLCETGMLNVPSCKLFGRTKLHLNLEMVKRIRKTFNCSTQAVFHSAFNGALKKITKRKEKKIPAEILGALSAVRFPYPNEYPHIRAILSAGFMPIGIDDPVVRLRKINEILQTISTPDVVLTNVLFTTLIGLLPAKILHAIFTSLFKLAYYISNVPGIVGSATITGKEVPLIFGVGPIVNGMCAVVGLACYNGNFCAGFVVEKSELFKTRQDLDELIEEFENELKFYLTASSV